jgi:hypothetical protein
MEEQMNQQSAFTKSTDGNPAAEPKKSGTKEQGGDYIDFEEVK